MGTGSVHDDAVRDELGTDRAPDWCAIDGRAGL